MLGRCGQFPDEYRSAGRHPSVGQPRSLWAEVLSNRNIPFEEVPANPSARRMLTQVAPS